MVKALSVDLRKRVVSAVDDGMSRHEAAAHFGVSVASAVRWCSLYKRQGSVIARPQGGDRRSQRIEALAPDILALVRKQPDMTLAELQDKLRQVHQQSFGVGTLWRFFDRHDETFKKSPRMQPNKSARTS